MEDYNLIIGSHVSMSSPNYYLGSVREALSYGSNTFMIYTGAPQNIKRTPTEKCKINEGIKLAEENNMNLNNIICHAPYLINLGNIKNPNTYKLSLDLLKSEIQRTSDFHIKILVLHPGASLNEDRKKSLDQLINGLNAALNNDNDIKIAIETMAGKGSELCNNFEEVAYVLKNVKFQNKIGVCLDTCHINDAGYNLNDFDKVLDDFDKIVGLNKLLVLHINDSKNPIGSRKDRHENIGFGSIGFNNLINVIYNKRLNNLPKILETPYVNGKPPYKIEITMIKNKKFDKNCFSDF